MTFNGDLEQSSERENLTVAGVPSNLRGSSHHSFILEPSQVILALEKAKSLVEEGKRAEARKEIENILLPVLERPWALEIWINLLQPLKAEEEVKLKVTLKGWLSTVEAFLGEQAKHVNLPQEPVGLVSKTLARLYWNQGYREKALEIYRTLTLKDPQDKFLQREFRDRLRQTQDGILDKDKVILALEEWIRKIQQRKKG